MAEESAASQAAEAHGAARPWPRWLPVALIAVAFIHNTWRSWLCWGDLVTDCGRDLDVALAVLQGVPLYAKATYLYGPLPPLFNAALFGLFGVNAGVLFLAGWLSAVAATVLIYRIARLFAPRSAAACAAIAFVYLCAFGHYALNGIFNWVFPYTYAATYGMLFGLASLFFLLKHLRRDRGRYLLLSALFLAGAALSKLEPLIPCCAVHFLFMVYLVRFRRESWKSAVPAYGLAAVLVAGVYGYFLSTTGAALFSENIFPAGTVGAEAFHRRYLGLDDPLLSLKLIALSCAAVLAVLCGAALVSRMAGEGARSSRWAASVPAFLFGAAVFYILPLDASLRFVPFACALGFALAARRAWRERSAAAWMRILLYLFALCSLLRILFQTWAHHFGFFLLPVPLSAVAVLLFELRDAPIFRRAHVWVWASAVTGLFLGLCARHLLFSADLYELHTVALSSPRGRLILKDENGLGKMEAGLAKALAQLPAGTRVLPLPQGLGLIFFSGLENSNRKLLFYPVNFSRSGDEERILQDLEAAPPDVVVWGLGGDFSDYGLGAFGTGFGVRVAAWINRRYEPWVVVGSGEYVRIMKRKPPSERE
ncbi:MAG: glycosyltransferase family 39 protein [Planctomycetes bacterium]|nr:glycosyltransferase family 39 protein [Planctomycetota bacterium]